MTKNVTLKELRPRLPKIMDEIDSKMDRFVITKHGKPVALMMAMDDYESILETLNVLSDKGLMKRIKQAEHDIKKGNFKNFKKIEEIEKDLGIA
jgi:prevent-host-death family protein